MVKLKIIQTNGKIFCAHGLEKAVLLKYLYYAKQSKSNPNQNSNSTVHRNRTNNSKICMKPWKTPNGQSHPKKEKQS